MPARKAEINKKSRYAPYPVWKIAELIKLISPNEKGLSTMNKGYKLNVLTKLIKEHKIDENEPLFNYVKTIQEKDYGMRGKTIRPYTDQEQKNFIQNLDYEPLKQKKLDPVKHKIAYNKNLVITIQKHQEDFVVSFLNDHLQGCLLFHSVGSGKTLTVTAVIFSHYYLTLKHNVSSLPSGWHHFCLSFDGLEGNCTYYIDSIKVDTKTFAKNSILYYNFLSPLLLGSSTVRSTSLNDLVKIEDGYKFKGKVSELMIYNKSLNSSEVEQLYFSDSKSLNRDSLNWNIYV